ncbi:TPA: hypothetical protein HA241_00540 [Candidatus Woesearchaeota archaeon]|nr:hypothetical protein [Candidatus Woesearchaeota archaeon]
MQPLYIEGVYVEGEIWSMQNWGATQGEDVNVGVVEDGISTWMKKM